MLDLNAAFVAKNKKALLEEIAIQLSRARELVDIASINADNIPGAFIGIASSIGAMEGYFKQYMLFRRGEIAPPQPIGFQIFEVENGGKSKIPPENIE